jgi:hypothetical protein
VVVGASVVVVVGASVVVVVVVVGTGAGAHAANSAMHATMRTTRSEPCFRMEFPPSLSAAKLGLLHGTGIKLDLLSK